MNIQQFKYVLAVADSNNFQSAAEKCFISQSTLSTMIGRFEMEIDIKIFNRKTKPLSITPEGEKIIKRLRIINNEIEQLKDFLKELKGEMVGELKIGIIPTVAPYLLPLFLSEFAKKIPRIKIIVKEIPTEEIIKKLKNRSLDIGILALPVIDIELVEHKLYEEPFLIYDCRQEKSNEKVSIGELDYSKLWLLKEGHCLRTQVLYICEKFNKYLENQSNFEFESASMDSLLRFTKSNKGITIVPYLASLDISSKEKSSILEFEAPSPSRSIGIITNKNFPKKRITKFLSNTILNAVLDLIPKDVKTLTVIPK